MNTLSTVLLIFIAIAAILIELARREVARHIKNLYYIIDSYLSIFESNHLYHKARIEALTNILNAYESYSKEELKAILTTELRAAISDANCSNNLRKIKIHE